MTKYKINVDSVGYSYKPSDNQTGNIVNRIKQGLVVEQTPQELASLVTRGHSWTPSLFQEGKKGSKKSDFLQTQAFALDFDSGYTTEEAKQNHIIRDNASFMYRTFSDSPELEKFRVVFFLDKVIGWEDTVELYDKMKDLFPQADKAAFDVSRLFYGGKTPPIEIDYEAELEVESFLGHEVVEVTNTVNLGQIKLFEAKEVKLSKKQRIAHSIKWQNEAELKTHLSEITETGWTVASRANAIEKLKTIPLDAFLGVESGSMFHALFRTDNTPSANVFQVENGHSWLYKDFGNNEVLDIIQICQKYMQKGTYKLISRNYVIHFLLGCLEAKIEETEELKAIRNGVEEFGKFLLSDSLKTHYPSTAKIFDKKTAKDIMAILNIFETATYEDSGQEVQYSWLSHKNIANRIGTSPSRVTRLIKLMALSHIIEDLPEEEIPTDILAIIKRNQEFQLNQTTGKWEKRKTARARRSAVKQITLLSDDFFNQFTERNDELTTNNFRIGAISYEWILMTFGESEAVRVFPQEDGRKISKKTMDFSTLLAQEAMSQINLTGFVIVNELKETLKNQTGKTGYTERKYSQCLNELLNGYGLQKKSLTNALKEEFGITHLPSNARPTIIMKST